MLDVKVFDVDHGFSIVIDPHNHHAIVLDVGFNSRNGSGAWQYLLKHHYPVVDCLIVPAYVSEHLDGIPEFLEHLAESGITIQRFIANPTLALDQFPELQEISSWARNPLEVAAKHHPECQRISQSITISGVNFDFFWSSPQVCQDVRDLSLVTFLRYEDINMILPSDLKTAGWQTLLRCDEFRERLRQVNIFVASNHGREDGYCPEVFDDCKPDLVIVSNEGDYPLSTTMLERYERHAKGAPSGVCDRNVCDRRVLTTHDNGTITVSKCLDRLRQVTFERYNPLAGAV
jgi:beta-lactamase superfamily II metal-dependent hydrolase